MQPVKNIVTGPTIALFAVLFPAPLEAEPTLVVTPSEGVFDEPFEVRLEDAPPNEQVTIRAIRTSESGTAWITSGLYWSDETGRVDVSTTSSVGGSYRGISPHGLLCSALPEGAGGFDSYIEQMKSSPRSPRFFRDPLEPIPVRVEALVDGTTIASYTATRGYAVGVSGEEVESGQWIRGVYFAPPDGVTHRAPVLILNGSGGGVREQDAARLASHGHPAFAFAIYNYGDLPDSLEEYSIERISEGARWLAARAETKSVAIIGVSRGSEAAAHAAIAFPDLISGVVLSVPSHLSDAGALAPGAEQGDGAWILDDKPFPVTDLGFWVDDPRIAEQAQTLPGYNASGLVLGKWGSQEFEDMYGIAFEQIEAPVLVLAAAEDSIWPSWISADRIRQRFERAGKAEQVDMRIYPGAGHSIVRPGFGGPLSTFAYNPGIPGFMAFGGTPNGNCEAAFQSTRATLQFLSQIEQ